jgi:hypothetical protein
MNATKGVDSWTMDDVLYLFDRALKSSLVIEIIFSYFLNTHFLFRNFRDILYKVSTIYM